MEAKRTSTDNYNKLKIAVRELLAIHDIRWFWDEGPRDEGWQSDYLSRLFARLEELSK